MQTQTHLVIGLGELGGQFALGLLKQGYPVVPVTRQHTIHSMALIYPSPASVWLCVGESALAELLPQIPSTWHDRLILIQNELLPTTWQGYGIHHPTVISVWFEKKPGKLPQVVLPSVVYGPLAHLVEAVYTALKLPIRQLADEQQLLFELVVKNLYIQVSNIAGLQVGGTTSELVEQHGQLMQALAREMIQLQQALTQQHFDQVSLMDALKAAFYGDPHHQNTGRSAPARLARACTLAAKHQLELPTLQTIAAAQHISPN